MSLNRSIRLKRLRIREGRDVQLWIESNSGKILKFPVVDCSLNGIGVSAEWSSELGEVLNEEDIISSSKLVFDRSEVSLGRLVVKRTPRAEKTGPQGMAFATIDTKIPVDGPLSHSLEIDFDRPESAFSHELGSNQFTIADFVGVDFNNIDILERTKKFGLFFNDWRRSEKFGYFHQREDSQGARVNLQRRRANGRNDYLMLGSNDYLGLASHPAVAEAAIEAIRRFGFGSTGTPHTSGYSIMHDRLRAKIAEMFGKEDALIYASGYAANVGIVSGLCREQDLVIADILAHASIQDGIAMSRATCRLYKHNDMVHLKKILDENRGNYGGCLIITEGAFSMDGTLGKLDEIHLLARQYNARIMIDQAHCVGVVGRRGLGTVEKYNLIQETEIIMGLFSKSMGSVGGFVTGSSDLCNWLRSFSRGFIFASSFPPSTAAATLKSIEVMQTEGLTERLQANIKHFVRGLQQIDVPIDPNHETAIIPIEIRDEAKLGKMYQSLLDSGVMAIPVVYPVVSRNRCRFRFSLRADLTVGDLDYVIASIERAAKVVDFQFKSITTDAKAA